MTRLFGLLGTVTHDVIGSASGYAHAGLGGVLYQAAVLLGLGERVSLRTNLGEDLERDAKCVMVFNSGFDITLEGWRQIVHAARSGVRLAAMAAGVRGVEETYAFVSRCGNRLRSEMA